MEHESWWKVGRFELLLSLLLNVEKAEETCDLDVRMKQETHDARGQLVFTPTWKLFSTFEEEWRL